MATPFDSIIQSVLSGRGQGMGMGDDAGAFASGYREPAMGFQMPPANYWKDGNFMMGGTSSPLASSTLLARFPQLASIAGGGAQPLMGPTIGQPSPAASAQPKKKGLLDKFLHGGLFGMAPALGGKGAGLTGVLGLIPGLLADQFDD